MTGGSAVSRRWFIGGALSFGAFGGCRFFECRGFKAGGTPNLKFGVVSDVHVQYLSRPNDPDWHGYGSTDTLTKSFEWFRDQGVDAVVIAGDMADCGVIAELEAVAAAWRAVFPGDRAPDGRPVERVFVYGNHDMMGDSYARRSFRAKDVAEESMRRKMAICSNPKAVWERVLDEPYAPIYRKSVKGYDFVGVQWVTPGATGRDEAFNDGIVDYYTRVGKTLDPSLPFFHIQHPHPKDTCYGPWAWGRDAGLSTKALSAFPNAIALSGHSHYSLTDERSIWQGAFTSVGASSLRYGSPVLEDRVPDCYENTNAKGPEGWKLTAEKLMAKFDCNDCRQGMLWSVYDDCITVKRREFLSGLDLGDDWVMPLPAAESRPFAYAARAKSLKPPRFAAGAAVSVKIGKAKNRGRTDATDGLNIPVEEREVFVVTVPAPVPANDARLFELEFVAETRDGVKMLKRVLAEGYNHGLGHPKTASAQKCLFSVRDFAGRDVRFSVTPVGSFCLRGRPLVSDWMRA